MGSNPPWFTIARDIVLLGLGVFIILYQQLTGNVNLYLLTVASGLVGVPGVANLLWLARNSGTDGQLSSSPAQGSEQSPDKV